MGNRGEIFGVPTAKSAGLRRASDLDRLSPTARDLPPTAIICHDLPRAATFRSGARQPLCRLHNAPLKGCSPMVVASLTLWHIGVSPQTRQECNRHGLSMEKAVQSLPGPVTVCHIEFADQRRGSSNSIASQEENSKRVQSLTVGGVSQSPRELRTALRDKDDKAAAVTPGTATFGFDRRQNLGRKWARLRWFSSAEECCFRSRIGWKAIIDRDLDIEQRNCQGLVPHNCDRCFRLERPL